MSTILLNNLDKWNEFWGNGYYQYLLAAAGLFLLIHGKKHRESLILLTYLVTGIFLFWFPVSSALIQKCVGEDVYWRLLWTIPLLPLLAYSATTLCGKISNRILQFLAVLAVLAVMALAGKNIWTSDLYVRVQNPEKIPQEVVEVCKMIREDAGDGEVMLAASDDLAAYIRVYDPSLLMRYSRAAHGAENRYDTELYRLISLDGIRTDGDTLVADAKRLKCNYLVIPLSDIEVQNAFMEENGYRHVGMVEKYGVYRLEE